MRRCGLALAALCSVLAACFVEAPPLEETTAGTSGPGCVQGEKGCACYGNGTCESGLACDADVHLCMPGAGESDATGSSSSADTTTSADTTSADETTSAASSTTSADEATSDQGSSSEASSSGDPSGPPECTALMCAQCVDCVDGDACAAEFDACDAVNGCATAIDCLVECGLGIDCLDPCCNGLTAVQLDVVNALILCKSDECVDPCSGVAEFSGCP